MVLANQTVMREEQKVMREELKLHQASRRAELNSFKEEMDENLNNAVVMINKSTEISIMQARDELRLELVSTRQLRFPEALRFPEGAFLRRCRIA
jgi:hypothetical protein